MPDPVFTPEQEARIRELALEGVRDAILAEKFDFKNPALISLADALLIALNQNSRPKFGNVETSSELINEFTESLPRTTRKLNLKFGERTQII